MQDNSPIISLEQAINTTTEAVVDLGAEAPKTPEEGTTNSDSQSTEPTPIPAIYLDGLNSELDIEVKKPEGDKEAKKDTESKDKESEPTPDFEKMYMDTKAAYTKSRQEVAALKAKAKALEMAIADSNIELDAEVAAELEALKISDPEAWRQKLNAIENSRAKALDSKIARDVEIARRNILLEEHNRRNPEFAIDDYTVYNVLPRGITDKLEKGQVTFEGFLAEAHNYLTKVKVGPGSSEKAGKQAPIRQVDGAADPVKVSTTDDTSYERLLF